VSLALLISAGLLDSGPYVANKYSYSVIQQSFCMAQGHHWYRQRHLVMVTFADRIRPSDSSSGVGTGRPKRETSIAKSTKVNKNNSAMAGSPSGADMAGAAAAGAATTVLQLTGETVGGAGPTPPLSPRRPAPQPDRPAPSRVRCLVHSSGCGCSNGTPRGRTTPSLRGRRRGWRCCQPLRGDRGVSQGVGP